MADNKKYYYLKLKDNFFESDELKMLQNFSSGKNEGYVYSDILLKMYLKSLKSEGELLFKGRIPYSPEMLATVTNHSVGEVKDALEKFKSLGLITLLDNGATFMNDIQLFIGKSSTEAERIKAYRNKIKNAKKIDDVQKYNISTPEFRDKSLEIRDKRLDTTTTEPEKKEKIGSSSNVSALEPLDQKCQDPETSKPNAFLYLQTKRIPLSGISQPIFLDYINVLGNEVVIHAIDYMLDHGSKAFTYLQQILESYYKSGVKTVDDAIKKEEAYKQKKAAKRYSKPVIQKETVPDWSQKAEPQVSDEERAKIKASLSKFKNKH